MPIYGRPLDPKSGGFFLGSPLLPPPSVGDDRAGVPISSITTSLMLAPAPSGSRNRFRKSRPRSCCV
ncbi:hypothetical protein HMPREF3036_00629 [Sutterella sp. KLE1602]|nr:hypothetical protein HMPREF3036_00629 [Sutterella sp. KLE1602]